MSFREDDRRWMRRAIELARRGGRRTAPNPRVGAVLVRDGELVGEGWHRELGAPHAEREVLRAAGDRAAGATLYVTLEPCHLEGRTPPCSEAILEAGVKRLVYALEDPNPSERGRSARLLAEAGLIVESGLLAEEARALNPGYLTAQEKGRPYVLLKSGATLNGMLARADGSSRWITGEESRRRVHALRAEVGAVCVGAETARLDRPALDLRLVDDEDEPPRPVVFDSRSLRCPPDLDWEGRRPVLILPGSVCAERLAPFRDRGWTLLPVAGEDRPELPAALAALLAEGIDHLLVEGGGRLATAFLEAGLVDRWELFLAPRLFPSDGRPLWASSGERNLRLDSLRESGGDLQLSLLPED